MAKEDTAATIAIASGASSWTLQRLSALLPGRRALSAPISLTREQLRLDSTTEVARPPIWRFAAVPRAKRDPRHPDFKRVRTQSRVITSETTLDAWLDEGRLLHKRAEQLLSSPTDIDPATVATELQHLKKLTVQVGWVVHWFMSQLGPGEQGHAPGDPALFEAVGRRLTELYRDHGPNHAAVRTYAAANPEPAETNGGWPSFQAGPAAKVLGGLLTFPGAQFDHTLTTALQFAHTAGIPEATALAYGLGSRTGPMYKWAPLPRFNPRTVAWTASEEWIGHAQRNRIVQMAPVPLNLPLRELSARLKLTRMRIPGLWRRGSTDAQLFAAHPYRYEADISGYDTSVTPFLQRAAADAWSAAWPEHERDTAYWLAAERQALLTPSWSFKDDVMTVAASTGGTRSGLKNTAEIGTFLGLWATLYALGRQGFDVLAWPHAHDFTSTHQGDDVCVSSARPLDKDAWASAFLELGLKCDLVAGDGFLSRHMFRDGTSAPIAGRVIQQTLSNEREPVGSRLEGLLLIGFLARSEGVDKLPQPLQDGIWRCIRHAQWIDETDATSVTSLREYCASPDGMVRIQKSLETAAGQSWLADTARAADYNSAAQAVVAYARALGHAAVPLESADLITDRLVQYVREWDTAKKRDWALRGWAAALSGGTTFNGWLREVAQQLAITIPQPATTSDNKEDTHEEGSF